MRKMWNTQWTPSVTACAALQVTDPAPTNPERTEESFQVSSGDWQPGGEGSGDGCPASSRRAGWRHPGGGGRAQGSASPIGREGEESIGPPLRPCRGQ